MIIKSDNYYTSETSLTVQLHSAEKDPTFYLLFYHSLSSLTNYFVGYIQIDKIIKIGKDLMRNYLSEEYRSMVNKGRFDFS